MAPTFSITFSLHTTDPAAVLGFEVWVDDRKHIDINHVKQSQDIAVQVSDADAEHELRLVLKNKTTEHTKIDQEGNISQDARLVIADMAFDDLRLGHMLSQQAVYQHDLNGNACLMQDRFYGELGCNGVVSLKFNTPVYLWLLEHL